MNMFAKFDENPAMTLQDIKKTKRYGQTDARTHSHTHTHAGIIIEVARSNSLGGDAFTRKYII